MSLPNGLRVHQGAPMIVSRGVWTLLLTITEPGQDHRNNERMTLLGQVDTLLVIIDKEDINPRKKRTLDKAIATYQDGSILT